MNRSFPVDFVVYPDSQSALFSIRFPAFVDQEIELHGIREQLCKYSPIGGQGS